MVFEVIMNTYSRYQIVKLIGKVGCCMQRSFFLNTDKREKISIGRYFV